MQSTRNSTLRDERARPSVAESTTPPAVPLFFGTAGRPLFGWYHAAGQHARARIGVVVCAPFGYEMMCTYRACRHLAEALAASGVPAMRFDYDGTGDSSGSDYDPDRVNAWVGSIGLAIDELKTRSGVTDIVVFGLRFGALLAAEYARRHPVNALVLMAPITSGRTFVRELRALAVMNGGRATQGGDGELDTLGYHLSGETRTALARIDLLTLTESPAVEALVIGREDLPGAEQPFVLALERSGVLVSSSVTRDFANMVVAPHQATVPFELWDEVVRWVQQVPLQPNDSRTGFRAATSNAPAQLAIIDTPGGPVRETFVSDGTVFGVLCRPSEHPSPAGTVVPLRAPLPTILLLNVGMNHHVGCHRLWVTASRAWAARGYQVLRLDSSGIGDSASRDMQAERALYSGQATDDVRRTMDVLENTQGAKRFLLCGLCAGAFMAYHTAVVDPRVVGVVMINVRAFEWHEGDTLDEYQRNTSKSTDFYRRAALQPQSWIRLASGNLHARVIAKKMLRRLRVRASGTWTRLWTARRGGAAGTTVLENMRTLCRRGTDVLMVFGSDEPGIDLMEEQLGSGASRMKREPSFRVTTIDQADHTFTGRAQRDELMATLDEYLQRRRS